MFERIRRDDPRDVYRSSPARRIVVIGPDGKRAATAVVETQADRWHITLGAAVDDRKRQNVLQSETWPEGWTWAPLED